ncbi:MAG TPA: hypothetical protein VNM45_02750 [Bacillus sp. (in: firmicutes)]|nr:hypothetical protein [Bacillus sp. (in: firmicutes)]
MYIWNLKKLIQALRNGEVSSKHEKVYQLVLFPLFVLSLALSPFIYDSFNTYDLIEFIWFVAATVIGTYWVYRINQKGDQKDFWLRYLMLFVPIALRSLLLVLVITIIGYALFVFIPTPDAFFDETNLFDVFVSAASDIYFFYLMISSFKQVVFPSQNSNLV